MLHPSQAHRAAGKAAVAVRQRHRPNARGGAGARVRQGDSAAGDVQRAVRDGNQAAVARCLPVDGNIRKVQRAALDRNETGAGACCCSCDGTATAAVADGQRGAAVHGEAAVTG